MKQLTPTPTGRVGWSVLACVLAYDGNWGGDTSLGACAHSTSCGAWVASACSMLYHVQVACACLAPSAEVGFAMSSNQTKKEND
jgi:hypothetical protein